MRRENFIFILCLFCWTALLQITVIFEGKAGVTQEIEVQFFIVAAFRPLQTKTTRSPAHTTVPDISVSTNTSVDPQVLWCPLPPCSQAHFLSVPASPGSSSPVAVDQLNEFRLGTEEVMNLPREPISTHSFGRVLATTKPQSLVGFLACDIVSLTCVPLLNR